MPKSFRLRPKRGTEKFFRPPSRIRKDEKRQERWSDEYREARGIRDSGRWKKLRDKIVRQNPVCEHCNTSATSDVHHIEPLVERIDRAYDRRNLIALCKHCHDVAHQRDKMGDPIRAELEQIANDREDKYER